LRICATCCFQLYGFKGSTDSLPTHEKELLAIIQALTCWCTDLLGSPITIYIDHQTLENFDAQKDLFRHQTCWQEFLSHYDHWIVYIKGEDNAVVDALSRLPDTVDDTLIMPAAAMLSIHTDPILFKSILEGYEADPFCIKLIRNSKAVDGIVLHNGLLYVSECLVIPRVGILCKDLFHLTHNNLRHFGFDKSYDSL
jgi:hypothetical protein